MNNATIRKILLLTILVFAFNSANAQKGAKSIQLDARVAIPTEKLDKVAHTGLGGTIKGYYDIGSKSTPHQSL